VSDAERIRWEESPLGMTDGHVGGVEACLFSVWQPPQASGEWVLTTELPGMEGTRVYGDDPGELKAEAERLLAKFTASLAAVFPGHLTESQRFQVQEARDCLGTWDLARAPGVISRESVLADQVRNLLAIIDEVVPAGPTVNDHHQEGNP